MKHFSFSRLLMAVLLLSSMQARADLCGWLSDLWCGEIDLEVKAGIAPIIWTHRGCFTAAECVPIIGDGFSPGFNDFSRMGSFGHFFHSVPWTVGLELGYNFIDCVRTYIDFQYREAQGKCFALRIPSTSGSAIANLQFDSYRTFSFYIGCDYLFSGFCWDNFDLFAGVKVGFTHFHDMNLCGSVTYTAVSGVTLPAESLSGRFCSDLVLSAGGRIGADWCFCHNLKLVLTAEFLGQCARHFNRTTIPLTTSVSDFRLGDIGTEVVFPLTIGLLYSF